MGLFSRRAVLEVGQAAPEFALPDQDNRVHRLSEYRGRWVVLYFYPRDDTPGCTAEACRFQDDIADLRELGVAVLGISTDSPGSHARFAGKYGLSFPLLADSGGGVARRYGSLRSLGPLKLARRHSFVIDTAGRVAKIYRVVAPQRHSSEVIADIRSLQSL